MKNKKRNYDPNEPYNCPHCKISLLGEPIPEEHKEHYAPGATHFKRELGRYDWDQDRTVEYSCPDCKKIL